MDDITYLYHTLKIGSNFLQVKDAPERTSANHGETYVYVLMHDEGGANISTEGWFGIS